jgi:hypothetical protein
LRVAPEGVEDKMGLQEKRMMKELNEVTLPERKREVQEICGAEVTFDVDWTRRRCGSWITFPATA